MTPINEIKGPKQLVDAGILTLETSKFKIAKLKAWGQQHGWICKIIGEDMVQLYSFASVSGCGDRLNMSATSDEGDTPGETDGCAVEHASNTTLV